MFYIFSDVLQEYTSCDCDHFIYNKRLKTLEYFCNDTWMDDETVQCKFSEKKLHIIE
jgi:hypothetical protein